MKETYSTGTLAGAGSFRCTECSYAVALDSLEHVPECPNCGAAAFVRASLFELSGDREPPGLQGEEDSEWVETVRTELDDFGHYLAFRDDDRVTVIPLSREWTKVGRSLASDIRFDDPTVSRRHALIVRQSGSVRVLDDRSLNGVFLNGERVEWGQLQDSDELVIGRYRLHFLDTTGASAHKGADANKALA
ncbi:MAG: FHA domain-containing protein [Solirubrobacterales bacterium]